MSSTESSTVRCRHLRLVVWHSDKPCYCDECKQDETSTTVAQIEPSQERVDQFVIDTKGIRDRIHRILHKRNPSDNSSRGQDPGVALIRNWQATPGKRALLCGVTYDKQKYKLKGTNYDVERMSELLIQHFRFPKNSVQILAEKENHLHPTKRNIQEALRWLVKDNQNGDSLVFYFSGHGLRQPDFFDDELDGFDETICPLDFRTAGMILDNEINETIVRPLKNGVKLHAIIDACHSGTILDLPYVYSTKEKQWLDNKPPSGVYKGTSGGHAISISACEDNQLAADTSVFSETGKQMEGAMTYTFRKAIDDHKKKNLTYGDLLASMQRDILAAKAKCFSVRGIFHRKKLQEPLLSSSKLFDLNEKFEL